MEKEVKRKARKVRPHELISGSVSLGVLGKKYREVSNEPAVAEDHTSGEENDYRGEVSFRGVEQVEIVAQDARQASQTPTKTNIMLMNNLPLSVQDTENNTEIQTLDVNKHIHQTLSPVNGH